jgi:hypothetical protein
MKILRQLISAVTLSILVSTAAAQATGTCATNTTNITTCNYAINDDGYAIVPIPFGFPYYGRVFTHSIFFDNGVVSFYDPVTEGMRLGGQNFFAQPLGDNIGSNFHYSIMPLWSDLRNYSGSYFTETDGQGFLRYNWENISQFGYPDRLNTFGLEIRPTGYIGINYQLINISGYPVTAGLTGNASLGEWQQHFYAPSSQPVNTGDITNWSVNETVATDCSDPLINANCPGYAEAYFNQQCTISALYDPACPGYDTEFALCEANPLRNLYCPTYSAAQLSCSINPLNHWYCPLYQETLDTVCVTDPITNELCPGYQLAYECSLDPLYATQCDGYAEAYALKYIVNSDPEVAVIETTVEDSADTAVVDSATTATASPADSATAPVSLVSEPAAATQLAPAAAPAPKNEPAAAPAPTTTRQAVAAQRQAAARAQAAQRARENPGAVTEEMDSAASMEQQVEAQEAVLGAMGFVPGFDAYGRAVIPDAAGYPPFVIYPGQQNIDTPAARGLLGRSDRLHQEMVDAQYR